MEKALHELSAANLRNLLIDEVKHFVIALDQAPISELDLQKSRLRMIYELIAEKEKADPSPLKWGRTSTQAPSLTVRYPVVDDELPTAEAM
ncbi:MAG TPA: hypothetical protein VN616_09070 [Puia sp.]|nr:hypothetical protein [Puia sp.]